MPHERRGQRQCQIVIAALLVIGREMLSDRTKNKNIGFIAEYLTRHRHDDSNPFAGTAAIRRGCSSAKQSRRKLAMSAATIDRMPGDVKVAAARRRRAPRLRQARWGAQRRAAAEPVVG
jgi:hypothetical protein